MQILWIVKIQEHRNIATLSLQLRSYKKTLNHSQNQPHTVTEFSAQNTFLLQLTYIEMFLTSMDPLTLARRGGSTSLFLFLLRSRWDPSPPNSLSPSSPSFASPEKSES